MMVVTTAGAVLVMLFMVVMVVMVVLVPVSYTHLDVYKRQFLHALSTKSPPQGTRS